MKRYRVSPEARDDLKRISHYIAAERESPLGAKRLRERFLETFQRLVQNPLIGQACPEFGEKNANLAHSGTTLSSTCRKTTGLILSRWRTERGICRP